VEEDAVEMMRADVENVREKRSARARRSLGVRHYLTACSCSCLYSICSDCLFLLSLAYLMLHVYVRGPVVGH
jgi:hypothetical protein